jgi:hypothetical protein
MVGGADNGVAAALERLGHATGEQRQALESLVQTLRQHLGMGAVRVSRRGLWGFSRLETVQFIVGDHSYRVVVRGGKVVTEIGDAVGGVGLTHHTVAWNEWTQHLTQEIGTTIEENP